MSVNVQGTVQMLECARRVGVAKFVYAASSSCYGLTDTPTRADHPIRPKYPYALSKYQGEQACRSEEHTSELQSLMRISYAVFCLKKKITQQSFYYLTQENTPRLYYNI